MPPPPFQGIYPYIRTRLQDSVADVLDSAFDVEIGSVIRRLISSYGQTYDAQSGDDKAWLDEAVGLLVSARLVTSYSTGGAVFDLQAEKTDKNSRSLAEGGTDQKKVWILEANQAYVQISFVALAMGGQTWQTVAVGGRRRSEDHPPLNVYDLAFGEDCE